MIDNLTKLVYIIRKGARKFKRVVGIYEGVEVMGESSNFNKTVE